MIDLTKLSQFQQWGLAHVTRLANEEIERQNATKRDEEKTPLFTVQTYADKVFSDVCNSYWNQCQEFGLREQIIPKLVSLPFEQQYQLRAQYNIPNVIPDEYLEQLPK
jgi:hypothetical protein